MEYLVIEYLHLSIFGILYIYRVYWSNRLKSENDKQRKYGIASHQVAYDEQDGTTLWNHSVTLYSS